MPHGVATLPSAPSRGTDTDGTRSRGGGDLPTVGLPAELAALSADLGITLALWAPSAGLSSAAEPPIDASEAQVAAVALKAAAVVVLEESDS